ncbi:MAG: hypothetical protein ACREJM_07380 [Candidatus Saccharimonadales bacterium]
MNHKHPVDIQALFEEGTQIDAALADAVRDALIMHKRMGYPVAAWRDGRVVWIPPEEIVVDELPAQE